MRAVVNIHGLNGFGRFVIEDDMVAEVAHSVHFADAVVFQSFLEFELISGVGFVVFISRGVAA
jgi:hypothetical protein